MFQLLRADFYFFTNASLWLAYTFSIDGSLFYSETSFCLNRLTLSHEIEKCCAWLVRKPITLYPQLPQSLHEFHPNHHRRL